MEIKFARRIKEQAINYTRRITNRADALGSSDTIYLSVGIPQEPLDPVLKRESIVALNKNYTVYTGPAGLPELTTLVAQSQPSFQKKENIIITAGVAEAVFLVIASLVNPDDEVIMISPSYFIYRRNVSLFGGRAKYVQLEQHGHRFVLDVKKVERAVTKKTKLIILNSPHNPTGWVADKKTVAALSRLADKHKIFLLSDEVYHHFLYHRRFYQPASYTLRTITVNGISKAFSATGLRIGWIVAQESIIEKILPLHQLLLFSSPTPFQYAAYQLLKSNYQPRLKRFIASYQRRRDLMYRLLSEIPGLELTKPDGSFYMFPKLPHHIDSLKFAEALVDKKHVAVVPGWDYGPEWQHHVRIAYTQPESKIKEACGRIADFLSRY